MSKNLIIPTGYYGTGSSAITDIMKEFESVFVKSDFEIRFLHDPYGLSDLFHHLIENPNRHNSSYYLNKFINQINDFAGNKYLKRYNHYFNYKFLLRANHFVDRIIISKFKGYFHQDVNDLNFMFRFSYKVLNKLLQSTLYINQERGLNLPFNKYTYIVNSDYENFISASTELISNLVDDISGDQNFVLIDQFFPPSNVARYSSFYNKAKVIIVDRDPRDIYLLEKYFIKGSIVPTKDIDVFCEWFESIRVTQERECLEENVLLISFEDLVFNYDSKIEEIIQFVGLDSSDHLNKFKYFNPLVSRKNTNLSESFPNESHSLTIIERRLGKFIYDFKR